MPIPNNEADVVYSPSDACSTSHTVPSCAQGTSLKGTSTINSSVSFNYSGPSVMVHTITSRNGGVFAVFIDGFNTTTTLNTFSDAEAPLPLCYPTQYPPVLVPPPDMETRDNHTITLVYIGPSLNAPEGAESNVQFDAFAIPDFTKVLASSANGAASTWVQGHYAWTAAVSVILWCAAVANLFF